MRLHVLPKIIIIIMAFFTIYFVHSAESAFIPAFSSDAVDIAHCRQIYNGTDIPVVPEQVKKALGFIPAENWEDNKWDFGERTANGVTTFEYLLVLNTPTTVGSMSINPAEEGTNNSINGGEFFYLKPGIAIPPDPHNPAQWEKVIFPSATPYLRYFTFPVNTKTQAFLYKDIRQKGTPFIDHLGIYRNRLFNNTPSATGYAEGGFKSTDPDGLPRGGDWTSSVGDAKRPGISDKNPTWYILSWKEAQPINGIFIRSNVKKLRWYTLKDNEGGNPGLAPAGLWLPLNVQEDITTTHSFKYWSCNYRWLTLPTISTRALKVEILGCDGNSAWINSMGTFLDIKNNPAPVIAIRDTQPPFKVPYVIPQDGEMAMVVDNTNGQRIRNVMAQIPCKKGNGEWQWNLKDERGNFVTPGNYKMRAIAGPSLQLLYQMTPYPNIQQFWPDRTPWLTGHDGENGWLSDHTQNWACTTRGDKVYFGTPMAEAGVALIECDLTGKKLWGKHDFGPWTGVGYLAADEQAVYIESNGRLFRMNPDNHEVKKLCDYGRINRKGMLSAMTASRGRIYLSFTSDALFDNAASADMLDLPNCSPKATGELGRLLRCTGTPPGKDAFPYVNTPQGNGKLYLESTCDQADVQYSIIAFKNAVPLGSLVFPHPKGAVEISISYLKPDGAYPPLSEAEDDWIQFDNQGQTGKWESLSAPVNVSTRAIRIAYTRQPGSAKKWFGKLDGLKILNRRFADLSAGMKVRVNSGEINEDGEWDAKRTEAIGPEKPGIYLMEWEKPQKISGLAIKEIDAAVTAIDVWEGPAATPISMEDNTNWHQVATYKQKRRIGNYSGDDNYFARYMDGYVEFRENGQQHDFTTRAVRLRVIEPFLDNDNGGCQKADEPLGHGLHITQTYIMKLDTRRCRVLGVIALQYIGGEPAIDLLINHRLEVYDGNNGKLLNEFPAKIGWGMATGPNGDIFAIAQNHREIVKIEPETGIATTVVKNIEPSRMTVGPDGSFICFPWTNNSKEPVQVYSADGKFIRTIGHAGGIKAGAWDSQCFGNIVSMCVDSKGSLWIPETDNFPRRILQYNTKDGTLVKEILGNTFYGGGGTMNRYDKNRAYYGKVEFALDWTNHSTKIKSLLADSVASEDLTAVRLKGYSYLVTAPLKLHDRQSSGVVYLYDEKNSTLRMASAFGDASDFYQLRTSAIISLLNGDPPRDYLFNWSDLNGNGKLEVDEIKFTRKTDADRWFGLGPFDLQLGCAATNGSYKVKNILPDGTPVFEKQDFGSGYLRLDNGNTVTLHKEMGDGRRVNFVADPTGKKLWEYPVGSPGVSGLYIPPYKAGSISNEFGIIGHETTVKGDLGEFFVVSSNTGQWTLWTADGMLASAVLLHKTDPRSQFFGPASAKNGTRLDPLTASQEHFHGFFTRNEQDGKYYIVAGFTHMSIIEVAGLEDFRRSEVGFTVTADDIQKQRAWEAEQAARQVEGRALSVKAMWMDNNPEINGECAPKEWGIPTPLGDEGQLSLRVGYDNEKLYLCWTGSKLGPIKNIGKEFQRLFKAGAALDFYLGTNTAADPGRKVPVKGDLRLLFTYVNDQPKVVLYQPVAPGSPKSEAWKTFTTAGGETAFDRVVLLDTAEISLQQGFNDFTLEAAIPLADIGMEITRGMQMKMDWGMLTTGDGTQVKQRMYWANKLATGTSDEATEARLEPRLWGYMVIE